MARKTVRQWSLFGGFSPEPRDPRGRPRIEWSTEVAETVAQMAALGDTQEDIAAAVGLSVKTLKRIYAGELEDGAKVIRRAILAGQMKKAVDGNTQAARFVESVLTKGAASAFAAKFAEPTRERRSPQGPRKGKKELALEAAATAGQGSEWGDDLLGPPTSH